MENRNMMFAMVQHSIIENVSSTVSDALTSGMRSENIFLNQFIMIFVMTIISYIIGYISYRINIEKLKNNIRKSIIELNKKYNYTFCRDNSIKLEFHAKCNGGRFFDYSDAYLS